MAANYNKKISDTSIRLGLVRFGYVNVFAPRKNEDGTDGKYSVQLLIPKKDTQAKALIDAAIEAAKEKGKTSKWNGKIPPASKLTIPLRDGDDEFPDDPTYEGMWFMNASTSADRKPGVRVLDGGQIVEALDNSEFYSGCFGCATVNFFPYNSNGNMGVSAGLNNVIKIEDGERLSGGHSAEEDFGDLTGDAASCLD